VYTYKILLETNRLWNPGKSALRLSPTRDYASARFGINPLNVMCILIGQEY